MIEITQRESFSILVIVENEITNDTGQIISVNKTNLEGRTVNFIMKNQDDKLDNDSNSKIDKTFLLTGTDAQNGKIIINLSSLETTLPISTYDIQVETWFGDGDNRTYYPHYQDTVKITRNLKKDNI